MARADEAVGWLDVLGEEERRRILEEWNDTAHEVPQATLPELFEQQVERTPEAAAVVYEDSRLSYRELNERANRLAHYLIGRGAGPEDVVAIAVPRSLEMMVALLGVLKSGAAYLPLDPDYPAERLRFMLEDAEPVCVVTTRELAASLPYAVDSLILDEPETAAAVAHAEAHNPANAERSLPLLPHHPAYVIYTSGSTGKPKGVVVEHAGIPNLAGAQVEWFGVRSDSRILQFASLNYDASSWEVIMALTAGAALVVSEARSGRELRDVMVRQGVSHATLPPAVLTTLEETGELPLANLIVAGEACSGETVARWSEGRRMINAYGPTETTVCATLSTPLRGGEQPPIGKPIWNTRVYVLDRNLEVAPVGVAGELYIAGAGLARGYLKRPGLTAERFVADPYGVAGTRMYRTGDLARWRVDGNLEFLGRVDQQVKIRGFRVETGEIEARLLEYPGIEQAAVVAREDSTGDKRLVAYVVEAAGQRVDRGELREYLGQQLPDYMVPGAYVSLEAMPLTANGKLDRRALPEPEQAGGAGYRAPRTPEEEILCGLFAEVLGLERVGLDDDFFELGGHSLKAVSLASRVRAMLGVELQLDVLFEWPRVSELGPRLGQASGKQRKRLERRERPERLPLSYAQQRLWFIDRLEGTSTEYNVPQALRLKGELNQEAVQRAINTMVERHESLRTHFEEVEGEPAQVIETELRIEMPVEDLSGLEPGEQRERVKEELRQESRTAFDLGRGPLLRMKLLKVGRQEHILLRTMHHIVSDGWSQEVFNREFQILYEAFSESRENPLKPLAVQYADFALWQREWLEEGALEQGLSYWKEQLAGIPDQLELPVDRARPAVQTFGAGVCQAVLSAEQTEKLKKLSQESQATLYMTLLAAFGVLLARYSGQDDIVVGTPIANRQDAQLEELIGFFINTLVMRMRVRPEMSFRGLLEQVRRTALKAYEHQDVPFERLVEELKPERSLSRTPVYQVVFGLQNAPWEPQRPKGLEVEPVRGDELRGHFDLTVHAFEREGRIGFGWVYNRDLFDGWRMEQMARQYVRVLEEVIRHADEAVGQLDVLGEEERRRILEEWNDTAHEVPQATLPELFEQQVERTPEAAAVVYEDSRLSYRELNERANRLAHYLIGRGAGPEDVVAIAVPRSLEMMVALLGVLKSGAAYLPLDPDYPAERLRFMLEDAEPVCVVTTRELAASLPYAVDSLILDEPETAAAVAHAEAHNPADAERSLPLLPHHPAYVIYTSGSTGKPKGVVVEHRQICNYVDGVNERVRFPLPAKFALLQSLAFDFSATVLFTALCKGGLLHVISEQASTDAVVLGEYFEKEEIESVKIAPSHLAALQSSPGWERVVPRQRLIFGGEASRRDWVEAIQAIRPGCVIFNHYGPTETTVGVLMYQLESGADTNTAMVPLGRPLSNLKAYVLDRNLEVAPVGVAGELYIAGAGLARGYLKRPGLTAERFVADPYGVAGTRMYRTGDLARWRVDGNLEFLGRVDQQVKIRGFRVETGEIEARLLEYPGIEQAAVVAREDSTGDKRLVAYVVEAAGQRVDRGELREYLGQQLPDYMVPGAYVSLEAMPLTANGKLDRRALPEPEQAGGAGYRAPRTPEEEILCGLFAEVLGLERVGLDDDFFELGGHSLKAVSLASRVRAMLGVELQLDVLFEWPRVSELGPRLRQASGKQRKRLERRERPERLPLSYAQQRLWFIDRLEGTSTEYNVPQALRLKGELNQEAVQRAINTMVERHESLRTHFEEVEGEPAQVIETELRIEMPVEDLSGLEPGEQRERVKEELRQESRTAFDLGRGPLLRMKLLKVGRQEHILLRTMHHIVSDGWSQGVFNREFQILYEAFSESRENPLKPLAVQYADFALWQREWLEEGALEQGLSYWKEQLAGIPDQLELPADRARPAVQTFGAGVCQAVLSAEQTEKLKKLSQESQATLYMTLLAAFGVLLARYSGQDDIVVGTPIANRQDAQLEELIGFFINTLVMRMRVRPEMSFRGLLEQVRQTALKAYEHQDVPFERLVEELKPERSLSRTPVYQVMFALQNAPWEPQRPKGLEVEPVRGDELRVRFDLEVHAFEREGRIGFGWVYNRDLFDGWRMEQMARQYVRVLEEVIRHADEAVGRLDVLGEEERRRILEEWNDTAHEVPQATLPELFEQQVERTPEAAAVVYEDSRLSYRELNERANRLAHYLIGRGAGPEDVVAIAVPRSLEMMVALLGVLKSGAAYLPLDPDYPAERLRFMLEDAEPVCVVTTRELAASLPYAVDSLILDEPETAAAVAHAEAHNPADAERSLPLLPHHPAYVIYTSGSTGKPKGVVVEHYAVSVFFQGIASRLKLRLGDRHLAVTTIAFDIAILELLIPLCYGAEVIVAGKDAIQNPKEISSLIHKHRVNSIQATPSYWSLIAQENADCLANVHILVGGEPFGPELAAKLYRAGSKVLNLYGPTEATVWASAHALSDQDITEGARSITSIGRPFPNYKMYVLDRNLEVAPVGVAGELYIGGAGLARGYLKRPGLTAERFVADPYGAAGTRMYRTGDLARWRVDGNLEFLGRVDQQVKIRGFRVETGEIEARLLEYPGIEQAAVVAREDSTGDKRLVAYLIHHQGQVEQNRIQTSHLAEWQLLWQQLYESTYPHGTEGSGDFNIAGWISSYSGKPIAADEMRSWIDEAVTRLQSLERRRVLEIGCGTGLLLTRLAASCEEYIGLDFSAEVLRQLKVYLSTRADLKHVELCQGLAHELSFVGNDTVDLVILNSVVQYFPDVDYLLKVLAEALRITRTGGHIFVGDVRNFKLLQAYHTSVQLHKAEGKVAVGELRERIQQAQWNDKELVLDPALFEELGWQWEKVGRVDTWLKTGTYDNELSRFRYDVLIRVGEREEFAAPQYWINWDEGGRWREELEQLLRKEPGQAIGIREIHDSRVASSVEAVRLLDSTADGIANAEQLRTRCARTFGLHPHEVTQFAKRLGVDFYSRGFRPSGSYDGVFNPHWRHGARTPPALVSHYQRYGNTPSRGAGDKEFRRNLQEHLRRVLPDYMVPGAYVSLEAMPLTANGKLDRRALPEPEQAGGAGYRAPRTPEEEILCGLFAEVLGLERVGLEDDFFELGGHSLKATRLVSRIRASLGMELAIRTLFEAPSVDRLSARLGQASGKQRKWLERRERPERLPLSYAQQRLWFIDRLEGTSTEYNVPQALRLKGELNQEAVQRAINTMVERHESLRTHFEEVEGEPAQVIETELRIEMPVEDLSGLEPGEQRERVKEELRQESRTAFDLGRGPLLRMKLLKVGRQEHILLRTMHHIVSDGWSQEVFNREFQILYEAFSESRENPLKPLAVQYADFALWQREWLEEGALEQGLSYWKEQLAGIPDQLELPADRARPAVQTFGAGVCQAVLSAEQTEKLKKLSQESQATLYMTLLAAFGVLLARYSGQDDIVVGTPIANRQDAQLEELIGFFINTLVMRMRVRPEMSFRGLLEQVRRTALKAYEHQDVPFERLVEELKPERSLSRTPVYQVVFGLQNAPWEPQRPKGLEVEPVRGDELRGHFDLTVHAFEREGRIGFGWVYNRDLFDGWRMEQMARQYVRVLEEVIRHADEAVGQLDVLGEEERRRILEEWNDTAHEVPQATLPELFEQQVERTPEAAAVVYEDSRLSYRELNERANRLAHYLIGRGAGPEDVVAIAVPRSLEMMVALLGVLKSGAAYLPLDPDYPAERLRFMLEDAEPVCVVTTRELAASLPYAVDSLILDEPETAAAVAHAEAHNPADAERSLPLLPHHPAYVIYTSGSTGKPKGVVVEHRQICNYVDGVNERVRFPLPAKFALLQSLAFDFSATVLFTALCKGGLLHVISEQASTDAVVLGEYFEKEEIESVKIAPSHLAALQSSPGWERVVPRQRLIFGGEASRRDWVEAIQAIRPGCVIFNHYGPTETTVGVLMYQLESGADTNTAMVPLGRPLSNLKAYVLDRNLEVAPVGVAGELYIAGAGLARGYLKRPGLTAERFVADPYGVAGTRMYRTGDLARWRVDGNLEFLGRVDQQVKIRGFRVETGEIEARLLEYPGIEQAAVVAREDSTGDKRLVAYVVEAAGQRVDRGELREYLGQQLPDYMVPGAYVSLEAMPLTANGKLDRRALPEPEQAGGAGYRAPRTPEEEILCGLFAEVLGLERVGLDDDFFELGGHSLKAVSLASRVRAMLGVELQLDVLFEWPRVSELGPRLRQASGKQRKRLERRERPERLPLSYAQQRLWFIDRLEGTSTEYNVPQALRLKGELNQEAVQRAINTMVERHESLRTHFEEVEGEPAQVIETELRIEMPVEDLSGLEPGEQRERVKEELRQESRTAFDLGRGPLLRMKLLKVGRQEHILLRTMHHIVSDGWSQGVFNREFQILYEAFSESRENPLKPLAVQYADFALWQREWLEEGALEQGLSYWKEQLAGIPDQLELPADRARPAVQTFGAGVCQAVLSAEQTEKLKKLSQESQATLYMTLLAAFGVLLARYSGQDDIVVGTPIANRQDAQLEELIGFFINTLVMRMRVRPEMSFRGLLEQVRQTALKAYEHQDVPFERLVEELKPERSLSRTPVYQVVFGLQNAPWEPQRPKGLEVEPVRGDELRVRFDLEVHAFEREGRIGFGWVYNRDLFDGWRMEQMARQYVRVLEEVIRHADEAVGRLDVLGEEERRRILEEWNDTAHEVPQATLPELFEQQVERTPEAAAVVYEDSRLSYRELNERANRLAHYLIGRGAGPEDVVAIAVPRSLEMMVALLGVLKSGAAYLPLDPDYPAERLRFMLEDAEPVCVVTTRELAASLPYAVDSLILDEPETAAAVAHAEAHNPANAERSLPLLPHHPAYVIYTSGSTGRPKGVEATHQGLTNYLTWSSDAYESSCGCGTPVNSSLMFDGTITSLFASLIAGQQVILLPEETEVEALADLLTARVELTLVKLTPSLLEVLQGLLGERAIGTQVRRFVVGGEALMGSVAGFWRDQVPMSRIINEYGPTEAVVGCCIWEAGEAEAKWEQLPIGRPINNTRMYVLDRNLEVAPVGVAGELYIAGAGLARGYLKRPGLTAERFVADPYGVAGTRMYRTGDLARWRVDGNLEFLGRVDQQVKIRGFRVETGEIEARLLEYPGIEQAAVVAREDSTGDKRLVAYVVEAAGQRVDRGELREYLGQQLPDYMVPGAYVSLEAMPLTANGKLDRRALPEPEQAGGAGYRAPRTPEEEILCGLFAEVLGLERVGLDDDFFELGGHSLKAVSLASRVRAMLGVELQLDVLFEWPRVSELGPRLRQASGKQRKRLERRERPERLPLSYAQQRLWFIDRLEGTSTEYNVPQALRLKGELNQEAVQRAINTMVERHESLRTHFEEVEGEPAQVIETELRIEMPVEDLSGLEPGEQRERVKEELRQESRTAFDLGRGPLLRMKLLKVGRQEHILLRTMHHIVSDGWSQEVFNREFQILYEAFSESRENPLKPLAVQYADFALWQREWLEEGALEQGLSYWKEQLAGIPDQLELPVDRARPAVQTFGAGACRAVLSAEQTEKLKKLSQESQATLYMTLLAAFGVLLARYSGQDDIVVGTPIANRQDAQLEELIGFFINTLVMRMRVRPEMSFRGLLEQVRQTALKAYEHQDVPFERLVEELKPERSLSRTPVYQVVFGLQNAPWEPQRPKGLEVEPVRGDELRGHFDLEVHAFEREGRIGFGWVYNRDLFDGWRMEQMARQYVRVLEEVIRHADEAVGRLDVLGEEERRRILEEWNDTAHEVPQATLPELFEQQVERTPEAAAVVYEDSRLSYRELNERANRLAHYLIGRGAGPEDVVAIAVPRSLEMMVALLGVLKSGAAYLPLDPDYPAERLRFMLEDAEPVCVVTTRELAASLPYAVDSLILDEPETAAAVAHAEAHNPADAERSLPLLPHHPAYVIYTSGSTGMPKGVSNSHQGLLNRILWMQAAYILEAADRVSQKTPCSFDVSVWELFWPLLFGAKLVLALRGGHRDAGYLIDAIISEGITTIHFVPAMLRTFLEHSKSNMCSCLRRVICSGEALPRELQVKFAALLPNVELHNLYGPTEAAIDVTFWDCSYDLDPGPVPIGKPIWNTRMYILDRNLEVAPVGVAGELYIAGAGLARGYLKRPGLTAERFVADPYGVAGTRMYRTGDLARWRVDGNLEFLGRVDQQVKIRGFRVETGEIEARLLEYPGIEQAAVVAREDSTGDKRLVAYVVEAAGQRVDRGELREYLGQQLPDYMVPGAYVSLEAMPLTANGKLDRRALPEPEQAGGAGYRAPRTPEEEILCGLFAEVLGLERVGLDDDFFELGGHSLKATRLVSRIRESLGVELTIRGLFEAPTPRDLLRQLNLNSFDIILPLRRRGDHVPLFLFPPALGLCWPYATLIKYIPRTYPIYGIQDPAFVHPEVHPQTIEDLAQYCLDQVRKVQPSGPYHLLGWSFGGLLAYTIATLLKPTEVALLALLDTYPPTKGARAQSDVSPLRGLPYFDPISLDSISESPAHDKRSLRGLLEDSEINTASIIFKKNTLLSSTFSPRPYEANMLFFAASERFSERMLERWKPYVNGTIEVHQIDCRHEEMLSPEASAQIGPFLNAALGAG